MKPKGTKKNTLNRKLSRNKKKKLTSFKFYEEKI